MSTGFWNQQWLNHNSQRAYPFRDSGNRTDLSGTVIVPDELILAFYMPINAGLNVDPTRFYLKQLLVSPIGFTLILGYDDGSSNTPVVSTINIATAAHTEFTPYAVAGVGDFSDSVGKMVIGRLDEALNLPAGSYLFSPDATNFEVDCIRPMIQGISAVTITDGLTTSEPIYGDLEFVAGANVRITTTAVGNKTQIIWSAIEGEGLNVECDCTDEDEESPGIKFINGIPPLPNGNFRIAGSKCVDVVPILNGLEFHDVCSTPCCSCRELDAVIAQVDRFADGAVTLQTFVSSLSGEVRQFTSSVLGSRLGGQGCVSCEDG